MNPGLETKKKKKNYEVKHKQKPSLALKQAQ